MTKRRLSHILAATFALASAVAFASPKIASAETIGLADLDLSKIHQDWKRPGKNVGTEGEPLSIGGHTFARGLGTHAASSCTILVNSATRFTAMVGVDDTVTGPATIRFFVIAESEAGDKVLYDSGVMRDHQPAKPIDLPLAGIQRLRLIVSATADGNRNDHANWCDAEFTYPPGGQPPVTADRTMPKPYILTPKTAPDPKIVGAKTFGVRPGSPILFKIPVTGEKPIKYEAENLPPGLTLDPATGIITGVLTTPGEYQLTLKASNPRGQTSRPFKIAVGKKIALTPPMGWNHWNVWRMDIDDAKIRAAADSFVSTGLIDHGWTYINLDDGWQRRPSDPKSPNKVQTRDAQGRILTNEKFPDMKALADYVHSKGLRVGLYSSPGPTTCGGVEGSIDHEPQDADSYAEWGFDYLKYDMCSYNEVMHRLREQNPELTDLEAQQAPYIRMGLELRRQKRDIVYSLCQYGWADVWKWGDLVDAQAWRTTGDIFDNWGSMSSIGFSQTGHELYAGPGRWNDPDMLEVGLVASDNGPRQTGLTPDEQYTHISLWSMLSAPLLLGCDLTRLDDFTLNLITNDEVIAVNQDPLGNQARRYALEGEIEILTKDLEDGSKAVAFFNKGELPANASVNFSSLGLRNQTTARDLWRQSDLGTFSDTYTTPSIPSHGVLLLKLTNAR